MLSLNVLARSLARPLLGRGRVCNLATRVMMGPITTASPIALNKLSSPPTMPEAPSWHINLHAALGLATGAVLFASSVDVAECVPKRASKARAEAPPKKKKAGPNIGAIEAAMMEPRGEDEYDVESIIADRLVGGKREFMIKWAGYDVKHNSWEPLESLANLTAQIAEYDNAKAAANQALVDRLQREKEARAAAREAAGNSAAADAVGGIAGGSNEGAVGSSPGASVEPAQGSRKLTSRVYEAFKPDPDDPAYWRCICKNGTHLVCDALIKGYPSTMWHHLQLKHPNTWQELKGLLDPGAAVDGGVVASIGAMSSQKTLMAPKMSDARKKECDRACARWLIKSSRPLTLPERDHPFREFIKILTAGAWDCPDYYNMKTEVLKMSAQGQLRVKEWVSGMLIDGVKPSISGDIWSDRGCSLMGICMHGIDRNWKMHEWLVAATPFGSTRHTGEAIDKITLDALKRSGIPWQTETEVYGHVHGKVSDNASNMAKGWAGFAGGFCAAHTIELSVHKFTEHDGVKETYGRARGIVGYFNKPVLSRCFLTHRSDKHARRSGPRVG
jgi:hypothetical protein